MDRRELGALGEKKAVDYLRKKGYRIREKNFRCRAGEIDIVAQDKDCLVFVGVRTRTGSAFGTPEESVDAAKREKLASVALTYLQTHRKMPSLWRFDVVAIEVDPEGRVSRMELIRDAIG